MKLFMLGNVQELTIEGYLRKQTYFFFMVVGNKWIDTVI